jgi:glycosyltransferase involved in cell wall biosynthesis
MKIAYITSGAAGMFCGSCMKDNTLAAALNRIGHDAVLIPTYTPIRTDEEDVSQKRVFFGGINVYLQQKSGLFRHSPRLFDRLLDIPRLLNWVSPFARRTKTERLGPMTISMLKGSHGHQRKEVEKLVDWLTTEFRPDVVALSNVLISGLVPALKERYAGPIVATLQGDDIFLDALPESDRAACIELIRDNGKSLSGYMATSRYYADFMSGYLGLSRERIDVVQPGINTHGFGDPRRERTQPPYLVGYFARICPEKGFHNIVDAFCHLRKNPNAPPCKLRASGWLGSNYQRYFREQMEKLHEAGLGSDFEYVDCPTHADKVRFLQSIDVLSVPTEYREPKGLYVLESLASGVPVVQPRHGAFPELIESTGGGILVEPNEPQALATGLRQLLADAPLRRQLGEAGRSVVLARFTADVMARETVAVLTQYHQRNGAGAPTTAEAIAT